MDQLVKAFKGRRVLVTGHTGFKGSWLSLWLKELGAEVTGVSIPNTDNTKNFELLGLRELIHDVECDIRDEAKLRAVFAEARPEFVFHLAAQSLVRKSYQTPKETFDINVCGSVNVLEMIRESSTVRSFIYVTSDKCYRNKETAVPYVETDELGGYDPYSASKAAAEIVFASYQHSFFNYHQELGQSTVRAGNVIGGGDWSEDRIIPDSFKALMQGKSILVRNPQSVRPWQHVLDPLHGYLMLAALQFNDPKKFSGAWNFGPELSSSKKVEELVNKITSSWGSGNYQLLDTTAPQVREAGLLYLNSDKAKTLLGWRPVWDFSRAIEETARWFKAYQAQEKMVDVARGQIKNFMKDFL